ncbi:hypothetical protein KUTeg_004622 [Tegillarca granosa]|uniref:Doublecortin domain-containing protein n=1 Tax=Tegillarca granosa TaxID=220873 RepID=A0ABQ9FKL6_TEGGR|nr:hypothetical protein KUTeg_004622 [Tegillarca granosa]
MELEISRESMSNYCLIAEVFSHLNRLMSDISEAFGPKYKNNKVKKLFTIRTREVQGVADFFREDDVFIAVGNETLTENDIQDIVEETCSDKPGYAKSHGQERSKRKHDYSKEYELSVRMDKERDKAANEEKDRIKKRQQKMIEAERRALDDEDVNVDYPHGCQ